MSDQGDKSKEYEFDNSGDKPLYVPGFGCPHDFQLEQGKRFAHGNFDASYERITAREVAMLQVMDQLTDKPEWRKKVFDNTIVAKWKDEAQKMQLISEKAFEWCIRELKETAKEVDERFTITLDGGARCAKADGLVSEQLHNDLNAAIQPLLGAPVKDWHPGSNEQVLNLVHPSMYPLVYGRTRVLKSGRVMLDDILESRDDTFIASTIKSNDDSEAQPSWAHTRSTTYTDWSKNYQWLPCDVAFASPEGLDVKITSYINNLPYKGHEKLYECVEKLISTSIPLWNEVLEVAQFYHRSARTPLRIATTIAEELDSEDREWVNSLPAVRGDVSQEEWDKANDQVAEYLEKPDRPENLAKLVDSDELPEDWRTNEDTFTPWGPHYTAQWKFNRIRRVLHPEPFSNPTYENWKRNARPFLFPNSGGEEEEPNYGEKGYEVSIENTFRQQGLQVVVKMAGIELTPENHTYSGGNWHLEGMLNEHIVATAIYYFDVENVTESRIRYRQPATLDSMEMSYEQDDFLPLELVFDIDDLRNGKEIQEIGSIVTKQGRLLVFPNTRQHRVDPFELVDKAKPGHRRFIVLWLVDPHYRVLSTANVPPQQYAWWREKLSDMVHADQHLPGEVQDMIGDEIRNDTMTREQAEDHRRKLMEERTYQTDEAYHRLGDYSFCEH